MAYSLSWIFYKRVNWIKCLQLRVFFVKFRLYLAKYVNIFLLYLHNMLLHAWQIMLGLNITYDDRLIIKTDLLVHPGTVCIYMCPWQCYRMWIIQHCFIKIIQYHISIPDRSAKRTHQFQPTPILTSLTYNSKHNN